MNEKKIYLVFTDTNSLLTKAIKVYTRQPYNHASIAFDKELHETYSFGRKWQHNPFIGGFVKENIQTDIFKNAYCSIYACSVSEEQINRMKEYVSELEKMKHLYRYNFIGLFAVALNIEMKRENALFCSEFVANVLFKGNVMEESKPFSLITPEDLRQLPCVELIYEGHLQNFRESVIENVVFN